MLERITEPRVALQCCEWVDARGRSVVLGQVTVEIAGGTDESQMGEGLWEIAEVFAAGTELFGVQPEMIRVAEGLFEEEPGLVKISSASDALDIPE